MISPTRFFFGRDAFISYPRHGGSTYAPALRAALGKHGVSAYLDQDLAPPDKKRPRSLDLQLRRAHVFVLVITETTAGSRDIAEEVRIACEDPGRVVVPIDVGGAAATMPLDQEPWSRIAGAARESEARDALTSGEVSAAVVNRIRASTGAMRQEIRLRLSITLAIALIASAVLTAVWASRRATANALASQALSPQVPIGYALSLAAQLLAGNRDGSVMWWALPDAHGNTTTPAMKLVAVGRSTRNGVRIPNLHAFTDDGTRLVWSEPRGGHRGSLRLRAGRGNAIARVAHRVRGTAMVLDALTGRTLTVMQPPEPWRVVDAAVTPDGRFLAMLRSDRDEEQQLVVHDLRHARDEFVRPLGRLQRQRRIAISADGATVVLGSFADSMTVWNVRRARPDFIIPLSGAVTAVSVSPDGKTIAASDDRNTVTICDRATGWTLAQLPYDADDLVFSPDGSTLAISGFDRIRLLSMSPRAWRKAAETISAQR